MKILRQLEKNRILDSNYNFTDEIKQDDDLQEAIEKNKQLESEIKLQNIEFEKIYQTF